MTKQVQFWFDFASTYSYLSAVRIEQAARQKGIAVSWQPFLLGPIFAAQGWDSSPFRLYPAKGRYMWRDMERICADRGLAFQRQQIFPQSSLTAARLGLALDDMGQRAAFARAVFAAEFGDGRDISDPDVLAECLAACDAPAAVLNRARDPDIKAALFDQVDRGKKLGIFGAPSFVAGSELFWGDDRLDAALDWAAQI